MGSLLNDEFLPIHSAAMVRARHSYKHVMAACDPAEDYARTAFSRTLITGGVCADNNK